MISIVSTGFITRVPSNYIRCFIEDILIISYKSNTYDKMELEKNRIIFVRF